VFKSEKFVVVFVVCKADYVLWKFVEGFGEWYRRDNSRGQKEREYLYTLSTESD
jgi:hypothetical protein